MSTASSEWKPVLTAKSDTSDHTVSDVLTSELLQETPYSKEKKMPIPPSSQLPHERLEVRTDTSQLSVPASVSYYHYSDYEDLATQVQPQQLEQQLDTLVKPLVKSLVKSLVKLSPKVPSKHLMIDRKTHLQLHSGPLHQVPERFSQFIADVPRSKGSNNCSSVYSEHRDISDSMGSQATIFSTRQDSLSNRSRSRTRKRTILRRKPTKAGPDYDRASLGLFRRKALRFKDGSMGYRLKLRLRKLVAKLKAMKHWPRRVHAFVTKKKATQKAVMRKESLHRRKSSKTPSAPAAISAPLKNPYLGKEQGASRVEGLTDELKHMAGHEAAKTGAVASLKPGPVTAVSSSHPSGNAISTDDGKWSHISKFISEQQELSSSGRGKTYNSSSALTESDAPQPPPHTVSASFEKLQMQALWRRYLANVLARRIQLRQEITLFQALVAGHSVPSMLKGTPEVALSYNASIVKNSSDRDTNSLPLDHSRGNSAASEKIFKPLTVAESEQAPDDDMISLVSVSDSILSDNDVVSLPEEVSDWEEDPTVVKLHETLNRRSVLGEMLDYDSDDATSASGSSNYLNLETQSATESAIVKRYGTLRRKKSTVTSTPAAATPVPATTVPATPSSKYLQDTAEVSYQIPRSTGIHCNLNVAAGNN